MRALGLALVTLVACGGKHAAPPTSPAVTPAVTSPAAPLPPCAPAGDVLPSGGRLACRELPFSVTFPDGIKVTRQNDRALALYSAELSRGVMAVLVEPHFEAPDATRIGQLVTSFVKGVRADAELVTAEMPPLPGATIAVAMSFTTPDGGVGAVRAFYANHFLIAAIVGGTQAESKPDTPRAKAFLASLEVRPLATGTKRYELADGASIDIPATAWSTGVQPAQEGVRSEVIHMVPDRRIFLGIRELEMRDRCEYLKGTVDGAPADLGERLKAIYASAQQPLTNIEKGPHGDISAFAHADSATTKVVMYLICAGKTALQLTVAGDRPNAELRPHLDEVARTLVGAK